jgi:nucleotide-binding universal stress UspA family protein
LSCLTEFEEGIAMTVVVVPVAARPECAHALSVAFELADRVKGKVVGYHLHPRKGDSPKIPTNSGPAKDARRLFDELADKAGFVVKKSHSITPDSTAHWSEVLGSPEKVMPIIAPLSDLIVISRPKGNGKGTRGKVARDFLLNALRQSGRPTLVLPQRRITSMGKRVLIAWDQSAGAVQALIGALPVLKAADEVVIHCAGVDYLSAPKTHHARAYLAMHGVKAKISKSRGLFVNQEIEEAYDKHDCDLLVMGAYSRPRLMEQVLGGSSEYFIMRAKMPVLATLARS